MRSFIGSLVGLGLAALLGAATGYALGRAGGMWEAIPLRLVQAPGIQEMIPIPGPGRQFPGSQPQPGGQACEVKIYLFYNGRFYEMRPGPGWDRNGSPTGPQEVYPLQPVPGAPALPAPNPFVPRAPGQRF